MLQIQPKDFQYFLTYDGEDQELINAPRGWEETILSWERSLTYTGLIRKLSIPLKLPLDGAWLTRQTFYREGVEGSMELKVNKLNRSTWTYENLFTGDLDFSTFDDSSDDVEINAMEAGISARVKAYENVKYTFNLDVAEAVDIEIPGLKLLETASFLVTPGATYPPTLNNQVLFPLTLVQNETKSVNASVQEVEFQSLGQPPLNFATSDGWFYKATVDGEIRLRGFVEGSNFQVFVRDETVAVLHAIGGEISGGFNIPFDFTLSVTAGQRLFLTGTTFVIGGGPSMTDGEISASYTTISPPTMCKAWRPKYLFDQLIKRMNGGADFPTQSFLLKDWAQLAITSGDAIRQIPNPKLKTSFRDFFTSINAVANAGFGIESGKAVIEAKSYFFKNIQAAHVGIVKDFKLEPHTPVFYNTIKVGYPDQNYDEVNGRQEVNSEQIYSDPITRIQRELDLMSIYRADPYGAEYLRINLDGKNTTDNSSDNDAFFLYLKGQPETGQTYYRPEPASAFKNVSGTTAAETIYNLKITPKRNLYRHGDYLHGMLDKLNSYWINFESAKKNVDLVSTDSSGFKVFENGNISIASLPNPLFLPYLATITTDIPKDLQRIIDAIPTGYIGFTYNDNEYKGFIIEASINNAKSTEREFKLLLTPDNDLLTLIR